MDKILIITIDSSGEQILTVAKVDNLINGWYQKEEVPTNGDTVLCCVLGKTQLYLETFGELMMVLTGEYPK